MAFKMTKPAFGKSPLKQKKKKVATSDLKKTHKDEHGNTIATNDGIEYIMSDASKHEHGNHKNLVSSADSVNVVPHGSMKNRWVIVPN